jgi:hypothetical protein
MSTYASPAVETDSFCPMAMSTVALLPWLTVVMRDSYSMRVR